MTNALTKKLLHELPVIGVGVGLALAGSSVVVIGLQSAKKDFYVAGLGMAVGAWFTHFGSNVAIGAVERVRGLR